MKKRIFVLLLMVITTVSLVAPFLAEVGIRKVYANEVNCNIYHKHTGNSSSGGGCYSGIIYCNGNINTKSESIKCGCTGSVISQTQWKCTSGHIENNSVGGGWYECPHGLYCSTIVGTRTFYQCANCNTTYSSNPGKCTAMKGYNLQCNKDEVTQIAALSGSTNTDDWTTKVILSATVSILDTNFTLSSTPYIWNGTSSKESTYTVTSNGSYSLELAGNENTTQGKIDFTISNIDTLIPSIQSIVFSTKDSTSNSVSVKVIATDEGGSGLADNAYSFDGGNHWVNNCENSFYNNGNYTVVVKDKAGNQISESFVISNIVRPTNTENTASTTTTSDLPPSKTSSSTLTETSSQNSVIAQTWVSTSQNNVPQESDSHITKPNTKPNSKKSDNGKSSVTKTPDASVSGNSIRFVPYKSDEIDSKGWEESTFVSENLLLATKNDETLETISNNAEQELGDHSLWSILFSTNIIKTILIVFSGTFLSVLIILFFKKKVGGSHTPSKH